MVSTQFEMSKNVDKSKTDCMNSKTVVFKSNKVKNFKFSRQASAQGCVSKISGYCQKFSLSANFQLYSFF